MASNFLATEMGMSVNRASRDKIPITLSKDEIKMYVNRFQLIDHDHKGYISINDIRRSMKVFLHNLYDFFVFIAFNLLCCLITERW